MTDRSFAEQELRKAWAQDAVLAAEAAEAARENAVWDAAFRPVPVRRDADNAWESDQVASVRAGLEASYPADPEPEPARRVGVKGSTNGHRDTSSGSPQPDVDGRHFFGL